MMPIPDSLAVAVLPPDMGVALLGAFASVGLYVAAAAAVVLAVTALLTRVPLGGRVPTPRLVG